MRFDDLDARMRQYETAYDFCIPEQNHIVVRLDGRGFTRLTKEIWQFEALFDIRFRDRMADTTAALLDCGFNIAYGFSQSDEISLLFQHDEYTFKRKVRKIITTLAAEASAHFSLAQGSRATFDARVCVLPNWGLVRDYFAWRQEDAHRNALNAHCYWLQRKHGISPNAAAEKLAHLSRQQKHDFLFEHSINFNDLPAWQKRGFGIYWQTVAKQGFNPQTGETTETTRRIITRNFDLPLREEYVAFLDNFQVA
ncbi:guanylyltransferase [Eikenella longinqua]|uniref:tRNA(His) guanylyltransferase n=1 Tax=Eikenella longinqua TaxID=1795827 RepID=A0A1A9RXH6_9NEIS|nr:tRNA(His) guanylyltransferase Thg1 family protein [Eikenella longinqua]OAM27141.1 guanylyltransferase [Eikenella longinqua]